MNTCSTCNWWFKRHPNKKRGDCVLHNGLVGFKNHKVNFQGILTTLPEFGCTEWREDERKKEVTP